MVAALVVAGIYGKTQLGSLDVDVRRQAGYCGRLLFDGHLHRLITLVFFTAGGWRFCRSLVLLAGAVGAIESSTGTRRSWLTFFGGHLANLLLLAIGVALPLALLETHRGQYSITVANTVGSIFRRLGDTVQIYCQSASVGRL